MKPAHTQILTSHEMKLGRRTYFGDALGKKIPASSISLHGSPLFFHLERYKTDPPTLIRFLQVDVHASYFYFGGTKLDPLFMSPQTRSGRHSVHVQIHDNGKLKHEASHAMHADRDYLTLNPKDEIERRLPNSKDANDDSMSSMHGSAQINQSYW